MTPTRIINCKRLKQYVIAVGLLLSFSFSNAQSLPANEFQVKAVFLYNFTRFVEWPENYFTSPEDTFIIGIIGKDPFGQYLEETIANEKIGSHPIVIKRFDNIEKVNSCNILYINTDNSEWTKDVLAVVSKHHILTVSDINGFTRWGGIIKFINEKNKIKIQINTEAAKTAQLTISSKLLSLADIY